MEDAYDDYNEFYIWNRDLSANEIDRRYCERTGMDPHDLAQMQYEESQRLREKYRAIDGY